MYPNICAKIIVDTIFNDKRIITLQVTMPRFILSQFNKHRAFSSNAASSRAIPVEKLITFVRETPFTPQQFGMNKAGMVAGESFDYETNRNLQEIWHRAAEMAAYHAETLMKKGVHKQWANRLLEPFLMTDVVVTATDWDNFFKLRLAEDSQPEMQTVAACMKDCIDKSIPRESRWHLPYVDYPQILSKTLEEDDAFPKLACISAARCARVSYNNHDGSKTVESKDLELASKLLEHGHMSPFEHCAMESGASYREANFVGWKSYRRMLGK